MPYLIVFRNDEKTGEHKINPGKQLRIGRNPENDLVIPDSAVSGRHAEIDYDGGYFYLTDFQSKNGTFVNRELIISRRLAHEDMIAMGGHNLQFVYREDEQKPPSAGKAGNGATMHIDTPHHRSRIARSVPELAERGKILRTRAMIHFFRGEYQPVLLDKPVVTIGKDPGSDIVVRGWFVASTAAEIRRKNDGYYLCPAAGKAPLINAVPVRSEVLLTEFDMIKVGATAMQFQYYREAFPESGSTKSL